MYKWETGATTSCKRKNEQHSIESSPGSSFINQQASRGQTHFSCIQIPSLYWAKPSLISVLYILIYSLRKILIFASLSFMVSLCKLVTNFYHELIWLDLVLWYKINSMEFKWVFENSQKHIFGLLIQCTIYLQYSIITNDCYECFSSGIMKWGL